MLIVISPAKRLDWTVPESARTVPAFRAEANALVHKARRLSSADLQKMMKISESLAELNADRFARFDDLEERPAALAFAGDTYQGLEAASLDSHEMDWAQDHLRILSGLYGVLRPMDAIRPYRLEMGSRLRTERGPNLYAFWGDRIAQALNTQADQVGTRVLVNCASQEYFGAVDTKALRLRVITPVFMENRNGAPRVVSFSAKKARGAMARFIIQHRLCDADAIKAFDTGGYRYTPEMSEGDRWVFLRDQPDG